LLAAAAVVVLRATGASAGHADMFACRSKSCAVGEITDSNFDVKLAEPHFVMFYAPWCGHCKQLAPKLKKAAKELADMGIKVGAVDVEPNPSVQGKFPDIRGFPTLKFLPSSNTKKAVDYNGAREVEAIVEFAKQQAKASGATLNEPVVTKALKDMYTFFGRAAVDRKPAVLVVGGARDKEPPAWLGKAAADLRKQERDPGAPSPEARTRELLREASRATKVAAVKEGVESLLGALDAQERNPNQGPPLVTPGFSSDPEVAAAFGLGPEDLPALFVSAVDRKTGQGHVLRYTGGSLKGSKPAGARGVLDFLREALPHTGSPEALAAQYTSSASPLPAFPKPANVVAAEQRAAARRAEEGTIAVVTDQQSLESRCYGLDKRVCAMMLVRGGATTVPDQPDLGAVAKKYARDGFNFVAVDADAAPALANALLGTSSDGLFPALAVVKGGRRPRVAVATGGAAAFGGLLDNVVAGGATFSKLSGGLPSWPAAASESSQGGSEEEEEGFRDDEL